MGLKFFYRMGTCALLSCLLFLYSTILIALYNEGRKPPSVDEWWVEVAIACMCIFGLAISLCLTFLSRDGQLWGGLILFCTCGMFLVFYMCLAICDKLERQLNRQVYENQLGGGVPYPNSLEGRPSQPSFEDVMNMYKMATKEKEHGGHEVEESINLTLLVQEIVRALKTVVSLLFSSEEDNRTIPQNGEDVLLKQFRRPSLVYVSTAGVMWGVFGMFLGSTGEETPKISVRTNKGKQKQD